MEGEDRPQDKLMNNSSHCRYCGLESTSEDLIQHERTCQANPPAPLNTAMASMDGVSDSMLAELLTMGITGKELAPEDMQALVETTVDGYVRERNEKMNAYSDVAKERTTVVVLGRSKCGKSLVAGRLADGIGGHTLNFLDEVKNVTQNHNPYWTAQNSECAYTIIDTLDTVANVVLGIFQADVSLLVIDATCNFSAEITADPWKEDALLAYTLGVRAIVCCINKMDAITPPYSKQIFDDLRKEVFEYLKRIGYSKSMVLFVPFSALRMGNSIEKHPKMLWGVTLVEAINHFTQHSCSSNPLRLPMLEKCGFFPTLDANKYVSE